MTPTDQISPQLDQIIKKLDKLTSPAHIAWNQFVAGIFHSLGSLFGTVIIASILIYLLSQLNLTRFTSKFIEDSMSQINWHKIVPTPAPMDLQQYLEQLQPKSN